ncbi:MAG: dienelactone hydrolase family protein [Alphaproteobacteria bacterium]|nr:dienelactone hydrolase family protein [Alphaproteobacteria bacterium]
MSETSVADETLEVPVGGKRAEAFLYRPQGSGEWPGVVYLTDIAGIRPAFHRMARRLAGEGFCVLLPNIFHRVSTLPVFDFEAKMGDERTMKRLGELRAGLNAEQMREDGAAYVDFLAEHSHVAKGGIGVVGYCFTGSMAVRSAAARPEKVGAAASFHGGGLATDQPDSPHLLLPKIKAALMFGHAIEDRSMPAAAIAKLDAALAAWGGSYESEVYDGAHHGWTVPGSPVYNEKQAERHFGKLVVLLKRTLG